MIRVDGRRAAPIPGDDRGLLLGDGLFETLRLHNGRPVLWRYHWDRLSCGAARIDLSLPSPDSILGDLWAEAPQGAAMARITITRGSGPPGYAHPPVPATRRVIRVGEACSFPHPCELTPLRLGWAGVRIGINPALAGLKHTSRLEHVLARQSLNAGWDEGIVRDVSGRIVSVTQGNLWLREGSRLSTPAIEGSGVAGTRRAWILEHAARFGLTALEESFDAGKIARADNLYVSNARLGMVPAWMADTDRTPPPWQDDPLFALSVELHESNVV